MRSLERVEGREMVSCERVALFSLSSLCVAVERRGKNGPFSPYPSNVPFSAHDCERGLNDLGGLERERGRLRGYHDGNGEKRRTEQP